jgi:hypothetical protein
LPRCSQDEAKCTQTEEAYRPFTLHKRDRNERDAMLGDARQNGLDEVSQIVGRAGVCTIASALPPRPESTRRADDRREHSKEPKKSPIVVEAN